MLFFYVFKIGLNYFIILISLITGFKKAKSSEILKEKPINNITKKKLEVTKPIKEITEADKQMLALDKERIR